MVNLEKDCLNQLKSQEKIAKDDEKTIREVRNLLYNIYDLNDTHTLRFRRVRFAWRRLFTIKRETNSKNLRRRMTTTLRKTLLRVITSTHTWKKENYLDKRKSVPNTQWKSKTKSCRNSRKDFSQEQKSSRED